MDGRRHVCRVHHVVDAVRRQHGAGGAAPARSRGLDARPLRARPVGRAADPGEITCRALGFAAMVLPYSRPLTDDDLDEFPEDGHRYELFEGTLVVSPAPRPIHQACVSALIVLLRAHCPSDLWSLV